MVRAALLLTLLASMSASAPIAATVASVADGDTLTVGTAKIRLCGIDAPEIDTSAGQEARRELVRLALGKVALCTPVGQGTLCDGRSKPTSYGRVVASCTVSGVDLAEAMVRAGHACDWPRFSGGHYADVGTCSK